MPALAARGQQRSQHQLRMQPVEHMLLTVAACWPGSSAVPPAELFLLPLVLPHTPPPAVVLGTTCCPHLVSPRSHAFSPRPPSCCCSCHICWPCCCRCCWPCCLLPSLHGTSFLPLSGADSLQARGPSGTPVAKHQPACVQADVVPGGDGHSATQGRGADCQHAPAFERPC